MVYGCKNAFLLQLIFDSRFAESAKHSSLFFLQKKTLPSAKHNAAHNNGKATMMIHFVSQNVKQLCRKHHIFEGRLCCFYCCCVFCFFVWCFFTKSKTPNKKAKNTAAVNAFLHKKRTL